MQGMLYMTINKTISSGKCTKIIWTDTIQLPSLVTNAIIYCMKFHCMLHMYPYIYYMCFQWQCDKFLLCKLNSSGEYIKISGWAATNTCPSVETEKYKHRQNVSELTLSVSGKQSKVYNDQGNIESKRKKSNLKIAGIIYEVLKFY